MSQNNAVEIIVVGSCNVDLRCYMDRMPKPGETMYGERFETGYGGKGANQAVAACRLGASVGLVACLGSDTFGREYNEYLGKLGMNVSLVRYCSGSTGIAQISSTKDGTNYIVIIPGANGLIVPDNISEATQMLEEAKVGLFQFEIRPELTMLAMNCMRQKKGIVILNCAPAMKVEPQIYSCAHILVFNEIEASDTAGVQVTNSSDADSALKKLLELGSDTVIITLGSQGAVFATKPECKKTYVPVTVVEKPVDTVGAGDTFCGALAFAFVRFDHFTLEKKIKFACRVAQESVKYPGAQPSFHSLDNIKKLITDVSDSSDL